ncbi:MAG: YggT family protein [Anderseniella sp.]
MSDDSQKVLQFRHTIANYQFNLNNTPLTPLNVTASAFACAIRTPRLNHATEVCSNKARTMLSLLWLFDQVVYIIFWIIIIMVVMSWLIAFNVLNNSNNVVRQINYTLHRLTEPLLAPIRRFLPDLGGIDLSPLVLLLGLMFLQRLLHEYLV